MIVGFDEVGRGCLAGPVVSACCSLRVSLIPGLDDSKKMSPLQREECVPRILESATVIGLGWCSAQEIDQWNIRVATLCSMLRAFGTALGLSEEIVSSVTPVDFARQSKEFQSAVYAYMNESPLSQLQFDGRDTLGNWLPKSIFQKAVVGGDSRIPEISAASVLAKVYRDRWMVQIHELDSRYGFNQHKGYGSIQHRRNLQKYGPSPWHRRSFQVRPLSLDEIENNRTESDQETCRPR